jgi:uroporphyrin-III C-methyltransferase / precorrin-2 dehydrogenase / sirohydrochlorin ferrochelatase
VSGLVSLVGAGPGDPELLTRRAAQRLAEADLVLYDALVDPAVLELAGKAQRFYVGKRAGRHHVTQEQIHRILIRAAQRGQRVVRLKGGDPFVFGRGGEEALALAEAGIAFEVVPGISSSVAAPALAGIPVTHRGMSTGFVVVSGHADEAWQPALDSLAPGAVTVVVLMGLAHRAAIASRLLGRGWSAATPAAIVWAASRAEGSTWRGTLGELATAASSTESADSPGTIVVGAVVSLAEALAPAASHPITAAGGNR